jgi:hypothetical protein
MQRVGKHDFSRGRNAAGVFDFFQFRGLATRSHRHHCLAALHADTARAAPSIT